ncbi:hypothetical protein MHB71_05000 [Paenibacillus sp. FSL H7-0940]|uniref:hypothetical protein n=1 Tax=Paenibacillus sp. FSL H7-0940 TaxID=2921443 RepID=UPI0030EE864B
MTTKTTLNIAEEWRKGYQAGYQAGRYDALDGLDYDDRTPLQKRKDTEETRGDDDHPKL